MLGRATAILDCFRDGTSTLALSDIVRRTGLAKSSASRITQELVDFGYLEKRGTAISLGIRLFELGQQAARPRLLRRLALPKMAELRRATGATAHLAVLEGTTVVYIEILHSQVSPGLPSRVGGRLPAFATGVGKALLASSPASAVDEVIAGGLWQVGPNTIIEPERLRDELAQIRADGVATEREESAPGISCVAAAIIGPDRIPVAAISVTDWNERLDIAGTTPLVRAIAGSLSEQARRMPQLGSEGTAPGTRAVSG